jgi:hypothetical protein
MSKTFYLSAQCTKLEVHPDVTVEFEKRGIKFVSNTKEIYLDRTWSNVETVCSILGVDDSCRPLLVNQSPSVYELLDALISNGMLFDSTPQDEAGTSSGLNLLVNVFNHIDQCLLKEFEDNNVLMGLCEGKETSEVAAGWLLESFFYTLSAPWHIEPILRHKTSETNQKLWENLLFEERQHWRIYTNVFAENKWDFSKKISLGPLPSTRNFLALLRNQATHSEIAYASLLVLIEKPPVANSLNEDPLYSSLCENYGYTNSSIFPLFQHSKENGRWHSSLPARILSAQKSIKDDEVQYVLDSVAALIKALSEWYQEIGSYYSNQSLASSRLAD